MIKPRERASPGIDDRLSRTDAVFTAKRWRRPGDHPAVRPASTAEAPWAQRPQDFGWLDDQDGGGQLVIPGDVIITDDAGRVSIVNEKTFRRLFRPLGNEQRYPAIVPGQAASPRR